METIYAQMATLEVYVKVVIYMVVFMVDNGLLVLNLDAESVMRFEIIL
jgi:hypothetical protein